MGGRFYAAGPRTVKKRPNGLLLAPYFSFIVRSSHRRTR